tara:strand:+ start:94 stop:813 length:720 start_codon:yes stop_codon:yes gene_type:complete
MAIEFLDTVRIEGGYSTAKTLEFGGEFVITSSTVLTQVNNLTPSGSILFGVTDGASALQFAVGLVGGGRVYLSYDGVSKIQTTATGVEVTGEAVSDEVVGGNLTMTEDDIDGGSLGVNGEYGVGSQLFKYRTDVTTAGNVYSLTSAGWAATDASSVAAASTGLLGVASSTSSAKGMIVKGVVKATVPGTSGDIVYLSTTSAALTTAPATAQNNVIRIVGYLLAANLVYFDPSQDYIKIA